jgi:hypothetical protein
MSIMSGSKVYHKPYRKNPATGRVPKIERLVKQGRLIPIIAKSGDDLALIGYRRKTTSRKANQQPILLPKPFVLKKPEQV